MTSRLTPIQFGSIAIDFPVGQAALSGYSDWPMRVIARRLGASFTLAEVLLDQFVLDVTKGRKAKRFIRVTDEEHPCGAQLMGCDPVQFGPAAQRLVAAGFDWIDLNFACPVRKVLGRGRGGSLLGQPDRALEIVARVRDALPPEIPVTVKMRRGLDDRPESQEQFYTIFDGAWARGAAAIAVHGRTVKQGFTGVSSRAFLREVKRRAGDRVVLGSGDLFTGVDCMAMIAETGVDGVLVARGAIGNPWIFREVRALARGEPLPAPPSLDEQRDVIAQHYRMSEETYGPARCGRQMRKFGIKYARLHPRASEVRDAFVAVHSPGQWREVLARWYGVAE